MNRSEVLLSDICEAIVDCEHKTAPSRIEGIPLVRTTDIENGKLKLNQAKKISESTYKEWTKRLEPKSGDIILAREAPIGEAGYVPKGQKVCLGQRTVLIRVNPKQAHSRYVLYLLCSKEVRFKMASLAAGSVVQHLNMEDIRALPLGSLPIIEVQRNIADFLGAIDDKITINQKMNCTLEAVGAALFKRWFVDFEFPNQEGKNYKSTGGKMEYNEDLQKEIPQGWKVVCIEDVAEVIGGGTPSTKVSSYFTTDGFPWLTPKDLSGFEGKFIAKGANDLTSDGLKNSSAKIMPKGTILFTSRAPIGYMAISLNDIATNQGFKSLVPRKNMKSEYLYQYLKRITPYIQSISSGSTFGEVSGSTMKQIKVLLPWLDLLQKFESLMVPINLRIINNSSNSRTLKELRDLLLPKLMSGKIRVPINKEKVEMY